MLAEQSKAITTFSAFIRLTRYKEYALHASLLTLFTVRLAGGHFDFRISLLVIANVIGLMYVYMLNDIEDAPDDALDEAKRTRNPIAKGELTQKQGYIACFITASLAVFLYSMVSETALVIGVAMLIVATLGTIHIFRLKGHFVIDVIGHAFVIGVAQYLISYFSIRTNALPSFWPALVCIALFSIYIELWQETRDMAVDTKSGLKTSALILGESRVQTIVSILISTISFLVFMTLFINGVPSWFLVLSMGAYLVPYVYRLLLFRPRSLPELVKGSHNRIIVMSIICVVVWYFLPI